MKNFFVNKHDRKLNDIKVKVVIFLFLIQSLLISFGFSKLFSFSIVHIFISFLLFIVLLLKIKYIFLTLIRSFIKKSNDLEIKDSFIKALERVSLESGLKTPEIIVIESDLPLLFSLSLDSKNKLIIISEELDGKLDQRGKEFAMIEQIHNIENNKTKLFTYMALLLAWPLLLVDYISSNLIKNSYHLPAKCLRFLIYSTLGIFIYIQYRLLLSRNRIFTTDFCASRVLKSTESFIATLEIFRQSPSIGNSFFPVALAPALFATGSYLSKFANMMAVHPRIRERVSYIRSLIG
jgi:Zn-dependent protease with chaperone function